MHAVLDVGGTSIKTGAVVVGPNDSWIVDVGPTIPARSQESAEVVLTQLAAATTETLVLGRALGDVVGLTCAVPGPFDLEAGVPRLLGMAKFEAIDGIELRAELRVRTTVGDRPIVFVRDSEAVGVGEAVHGAGWGGSRVLTIALGTGLGSCLTDAGVPIEQVHGEFADHLHRRSTSHGVADDVFSGRGLAAHLGVAADRLPFLDVAAHRAGLEDFARRLGEFLGEVADAWDVDVVVVAGGAAPAIARAIDIVTASAGVPVRLATLGTRAALLGAALLTGR